jgi:cysteinyl-tRNA synthetase
VFNTFAMPQNAHSISFFDTYLKREIKLEHDQTVEPGKIKLYSCGPTVYNTQHIGNMRAAWLPDTITRVADLAGWKVDWVLNITDVGHLVDDSDDGEDKIEKGAKRENKTVQEIVDYYLNGYLEQAKMLELKLPADHMMPKATNYIKEQMILALDLLDQGKAYLRDDGIYFSYLDSNSDKLDFEQEMLQRVNLLENSKYNDRNIVGVGERDPRDFALWKFVDESSLQKWKFNQFDETEDLMITILQRLEPKDYDLPNRWGCPGWHSECVAMISELIGSNKFAHSRVPRESKKYEIDIHTGGEDHIDIHHKNERLQSEALGFHLSKYWVHNKFVLVDNTKMSKSLGNTYTMYDIIEKGFDPLAYRLLLLEQHYSEQLNFTWDKLEQSQNRLFNLRKEVAKIRSFAQSPNLEALDDKKYDKIKQEWLDILTSNLNIPKFLDEYQEFLYSTVNRIQEHDIMAIHDHKVLSEFASKFLRLKLFELDLPGEIIEIAENRWEQKLQKNYTQADELRQEAMNQGWQIDDYRWGWGVWWKGLRK